jgi:hypothetical protein
MKVWLSDELSARAKAAGVQDTLNLYIGLEFTLELLLEIIQNPKMPTVVPTIIRKYTLDAPPAATIGDILLCHVHEW